jgi:GntR family transcriptional regulator
MRTLLIDIESTIPIYVQIMDGIRAAVREQELRPGDLLPTVRQLATDLEINPNTVAKAYQLLEREGVLRTFPRRGCAIAEGAGDHVRRATAERVDQAIERAAEELRGLGLEKQTLLEALQRKLGDGTSDPAPGGESS